MMTDVATLVLTTVNAPYGANLSAHQLAAKIVDPKSASDSDPSVFAFFTEVSPALRKLFLAEMNVDPEKASAVAHQISENSGYDLALAA